MIKKFKSSKLGLGTVQFGMDYGFSKKLDPSEIERILSLAHRSGIDLLDTAREYGASEEAIGHYCQKFPDQFTIGTKLSFIDRESAGSGGKIRAWLELSMEQSKNILGQAELPMLLLHQTDDYLLNEPIFWNEVKSLKQRYPKLLFGLSVYDLKPTQDILDRHAAVIDCIQAPYNVVDRRFQALENALAKNGIVFIARSAFLKGALVEEKLPAELSGLKPTRAVLKETAYDLGCTVTQLLINFVLATSFVDTVLIGVRSSAQLQESLGWQRYAPEYKKRHASLEALSVADSVLIDPRQWKTL